MNRTDYDAKSLAAELKKKLGNMNLKALSKEEINSVRIVFHYALRLRRGFYRLDRSRDPEGGAKGQVRQHALRLDGHDAEQQVLQR